MVPATPNLLIQIRRTLGLSQEKMAQLLGSSFASVNRWEGGHSSPIGATLDIYRALEAALRTVSPDQILAAYSGDRGQFLHSLFSMAYGRKRGAA